MSSDFVAGERIEITQNVSFTKGQPEFEELVNLPLETLAEMRQASIVQEEAIYKKLCASTSIWAEQAVKTLLLTRVMEYVKTMPVTHTSNVWITNQYGRHEISNMVYKMMWSVYEDTKWDSAAQKSITVAWRLSWDVYYNAPRNADNMGHGRISGQERKRFTDKLKAADIAHARINHAADMLHDPQALENKYIVEVAHPGGQKTMCAMPPAKIDTVDVDMKYGSPCAMNTRSRSCRSWDMGHRRSQTWPRTARCLSIRKFNHFQQEK